MGFVYFTMVSFTLIICIYVLLLVAQNRVNNNSIQTSTNDIQKSNSNPRTNLINKPKNYQVPKFMLQLYQENKLKTGYDKGFSVIRSIIPRYALSITNGTTVELIFELPKREEDELLRAAELRILTLVKVCDGLGVERTLQISTFDYTTNTYEMLQMLKIHYAQNTWISFNVTHPITKILTTENSHNNIFKIFISISSCLSYCKEENYFKLSVLPESSDDSKDNSPVLIMSYLSKTQKVVTRRKRSLNGAAKSVLKKQNGITSCMRKPLYINFTEINFDVWVVQPLGYEAYQCQGACLYPLKHYPTNHAVLQTLLYYRNSTNISRPCCVPTRLAPISMIYLDQHGILTFRQSYKNMVVKSCGCR